MTEWRKLELPFLGETIVIAVSGGADSTALTFAINDLVKRKKLENKFVVAHFNHNLRGEEGLKDRELVRELANKIGFQFISESATKGQVNSKSNIEESARTARYSFLFRVAEQVSSRIILTAHTLDDQAETFLINLIRGSGIAGLSSMRVSRKLNEKSEVLLVRPFLNWAKRDDIESFAAENGIVARNDSMNENLHFRRVKIRKELIPYLRDINPSIVETLANTSNLLRRDNELVEELLDRSEEFSRMIYEDSLDLTDIKKLSKPMFYRVLRGWLSFRRGCLRSIELVHIEAVEALVNSRKSGKVVELPGFGRIVKEHGKLKFEGIEVEK